VAGQLEKGIQPSTVVSITFAIQICQPFFVPKVKELHIELKLKLMISYHTRVESN